MSGRELLYEEKDCLKSEEERRPRPRQANKKVPKGFPGVRCNSERENGKNQKDGLRGGRSRLNRGKAHIPGPFLPGTRPWRAGQGSKLQRARAACGLGCVGPFEAQQVWTVVPIGFDGSFSLQDNATSVRAFCNVLPCDPSVFGMALLEELLPKLSRFYYSAKPGHWQPKPLGQWARVC